MLPKGLLTSVPQSGHPITANPYDGEAVFGMWPATHVAQMEGPDSASDQMGSYRLAFPVPLASGRPANSQDIIHLCHCRIRRCHQALEKMMMGLHWPEPEVHASEN